VCASFFSSTTTTTTNGDGASAHTAVVPKSSNEPNGRFLDLLPTHPSPSSTRPSLLSARVKYFFSLLSLATGRIGNG
jgi:hypothetical protein